MGIKTINYEVYCDCCNKKIGRKASNLEVMFLVRKKMNPILKLYVWYGWRKEKNNVEWVCEDCYEEIRKYIHNKQKGV